MDCEMGGRELKYSLLTAAFIVTTEDFNIQDRLYLEVKPEDGDYIVSGQGMAINKIDLQAHDRNAWPYKMAKGTLYNFLKKYSANGVSTRLTPVGHGVKGDIAHLIKNLISEGSWEQFCTYHYMDTSVVLQYLRAIGKMPHDTDGSVQALATYFGIHTPAIAKWHDAMFDAEMTMQVYKKMVELGKQ